LKYIRILFFYCWFKKLYNSSIYMSWKNHSWIQIWRRNWIYEYCNCK